MPMLLRAEGAFAIGTPQLRIHIKNELLAINLWSGCLALVIAFIDLQPLRLILAFPFLLFSPGYSFLAALFPARSRFGTFERIALSISLSVALVPLLGLLLNYVWEVQVYPLLSAVAGLVAVASAIGWYRRRALPPQEKPEICLHIAFPPSGTSSQFDRFLSILLIIIVLAAIGVFSYLLVRPKIGERFTEFYVLGPEGVAAGYPTKLTVGEEASVTLGVVNRERETMSYQVRLTIEGVLDHILDPFTLASGEKREQEINFALQEATAETTLVEEVNPESKDNGPPGMTRTIHLVSAEHLESGDVIWVGNEVDRVQTVEGDMATLVEGLTRYHAAGTEVRESQKIEFKLYKIRELRRTEREHTSLALWVGKEHLHAVTMNHGKAEANYEIRLKITDETVDHGKEETTLKAISPAPVGPHETWEEELEYPLTRAYTREMEISLYRDGNRLYREKAPNAYPTLHFWISVQQE